MTINEATGVTPFRQVATGVRDQITRGMYPVGSRIPSTREIAEEYNVALTTAVRALDELRTEGVIETHRGRGSFVRRSPELFRRGANRYRRHPEGLSPNRDESSAGGWHDEVTSTIWREPATPEIAERLRIDSGDEVTVAQYRWSVDDQPVQVSTQWEPLAITRHTPIEDPVDGTRGNPGVIARFDSIGMYVTRVDEQTRTRMPSVEESDLLDIGPGIPIFDIRRTHYTSNGTPVETANITIRGDRMVITTQHDVPTETE